MALRPDVSFKVEGLKELDKALGELPKSTAKNVLKRVAVKALTPLIETAKSIVAYDPSRRRGRHLRDSLVVSTRLSKRQQTLARKERRMGRLSEKYFFEIYGGAASLPHAHLVEFGTSKMSPQPFMRPAWDQHKMRMLDVVSSDLWKEIDAAAKRIARKTARYARKK